MLSKLSGLLFPHRGPRRVIAIGDSVTQNDSSQGGSGLWTEGNGYFETSLRMLGQFLPGGLIFVRNAGIGGNTTSEMLARVDTDVIAYKPDLVFVMAGTNDILPGATDADYAAFFSTLEKLVVRLLLSGADVVLSTCPTKDAAPAEVAKAIPWYYLLANHYGIPLVDAHRVTADPVTGQYLSGYSDDGTHPNQTGIAAIAEQVVATVGGTNGLSSGNVYRSVVAAAEQGDLQNLIQNGVFVNETVPGSLDYWSVNTSGATFTPDTVPGVAGKMFDYKKTAAGGAYALYGAEIDTGYADGDTLVFSGLFGVSGLPSPADGFTFLMQFDGGDSFRPINNHMSDVPYPGAAAGSYMAFSQEIVVPATYGAMGLIPQLYVQDVGEYVVGELTLWNKTAYEAIWKPGALLNS